MARRRKGWKRIDQMDHELSGITVYFYLKTEGEMLFDCEVEEDRKRFSNKDLNELKGEVYKYLDERVELTWREVIEIEMDGGGRVSWRGSDEAFGFKIDHLWISDQVVGEDYLSTEPRMHEDYQGPEWMLRDSGRWVSAWSVMKDGEFNPPCRKKGMIWLPYDEEVWAGLEAMREEIKNLRGRFMEFVLTAEGAGRLRIIGSMIPRLLEDKQEGQDEI